MAVYTIQTMNENPHTAARVVLIEYLEERGIGKIVADLHPVHLPGSSTNDAWFPSQETYVLGYSDTTATPPDASWTLTPTIGNSPFYVGNDPRFPEGCHHTLASIVDVPLAQAQRIIDEAARNREHFPWLSAP